MPLARSYQAFAAILPRERSKVQHRQNEKPAEAQVVDQVTGSLSHGEIRVDVLNAARDGPAVVDMIVCLHFGAQEPAVDRVEFALNEGKPPFE